MRALLDRDRLCRRLFVLVLGFGFVLGGGQPLRADEGLFDPTFREGNPSTVVVPGTPALTRAHLDGFMDLFEAAFDIALTRNQDEALRLRIVRNFRAQGAEARRGFLEVTAGLPRTRQLLRAGQHEAVEARLRTFRTRIDKGIKGNPEHPIYRLLVDLLKRRHLILWDGDPPIKAAAVDSYLELATFMAGAARGASLAPTRGQREALIATLRTKLADAPSDVRVRVARVHRLWTLVRARWDQADQAGRFPIRWEAVKLAARARPGGRSVNIEAGSTLRDYAREAKRATEGTTAFDTLTTFAAAPSALLKAAERGFRFDPEALPHPLLARAP